MNDQSFAGSLTQRFPFLADREFKNYSPELQQQIFSAEVAGQETKDLLGLFKELGSEQSMREKLKVASEFDKERMKEAGKYKMLFDLPERLIQAATLPEQLAAEGSRGIAASMMQAGQQIPQLVNYQRSGFSYTPTRYFQ
jgi:hypothetical protein